LDNVLFNSRAQRFALPALGRATGRHPTGKMLRRGKMLGIAPESPASGARFVSPLLFYGVVVLRLELIVENTLPMAGPMNINIPIKQIGIKSRSNGDNTEATARTELKL
jgi:hypothetical protein